MLNRLNKIKPVWVELGLQTSNEKSAEYIRRCYENCVYEKAVKDLKAININVITHIIIGLPNDDPVATTQYAAACGTDGVKFHLLHVLRGTDLEQEYRKGKFEVLSMEEYGSILKRCVAELPEHIVLHRITGDGAKRDLIAPLWSADKKRVLNYLNSILEK